ncbi:SUMF1/EgtB/PvdO family nonheme iron enzyme [bacterium]|nr:SUMF1/EgtB/PvdO family nonheme iron enzyme [bacterium]
MSTARPFRLRAAAPLVLGGLLLASGCAQQDLYEPPGTDFERMGSVPLPSQNEGVAVIGDYAFVAGGQAGLHTIDISNPAAPVLLQTINTLKYSESVEVVRTFVGHAIRDIALVVEGTEGITSYDITDPAAVTSFNSGTTAVFGNRVFIDQPDDPEAPYVCYLAESWKGVRVFESIPAQPGILAYNGVFVGTNGYAEGIVVRDGYGYVADDELGLAVLDLRILDLDAVALASWCDSPGSALDVELEGDYAFVADGNEGLAVFRIDDGETPVRVARLPLEGRCRAIAVRDGLAVLAAQGSGVHFVDVRNPTQPVFRGRILTEYAMDLALTPSGLVLVADRDEGLVVLRGPHPFTDATPPAPVRSLTAEGYGVGAVRLQWYATGDDRMIGTAATTEVRYAAAPIADAAAWDAATPVAGAPAPGEPGAASEFVVTGLAAGTWHFAVRLGDDAGLLSGLGNSAAAAPGEGILLTDGAVDVAAGTTGRTFTYEVTYVYPADPDVHAVVIDGTPHDMTAVGPAGGGTRYRYQTTLAGGAHDYLFRFGVADPAVPDAETTTTGGPVVGALVFTMGSSATTNTADPAHEPGRAEDEWQHTVVLSDSLVAAVTEVTQAQWTALGLTDPSGFDGPDRPVETVTWHDAIAYCNALSADQGLTPAYSVNGQDVAWNRAADGWRLPTEAEWEWLCRAGTTTAFAGGPLTGLVCNADPVLDAMGWYCGSTFPGTPATADVGLKAPNAAGLSDMHGNVWEWCWDWYGDYRLGDPDGDGVLLDPVGPAAGERRVVRGGSWYGGSEDCRSARRGSRYPDAAEDVVGLRVVRTVATGGAR